MRATAIRKQTRSDSGVDLDNLNLMVEGLQECLNLQFDPNYFDTHGGGVSGTFVTGKTEIGYRGDFRLTIGSDDTSGDQNILRIGKGWSTFGRFRKESILQELEAKDYTNATTYVICVRHNANDTYVPTVELVSEATFKTTQRQHGYDGLSARVPIGRVTVGASSGSNFWKNIIQSHWGECITDRYDPDSTSASGTLYCGQIEYQDSYTDRVTVKQQAVNYHFIAPPSPLVGDKAAELSFTVTGATWVALKVTLDGSAGVTSLELVQSTTRQNQDGVLIRYILLWELGLVDNVAFVQGHLHHGIVHIWGDTVYTSP